MISIKLHNNFIEISLRYGCSPVNLLHIFRILLHKDISGGLFLETLHQNVIQEFQWDHGGSISFISLRRSSPPEVFIGKGVLKIYSKFTGEYPCRSVISIKLSICRAPFYKNTSGGLLLPTLRLMNWNSSCYSVGLFFSFWFKFTRFAWCTESTVSDFVSFDLTFKIRKEEMQASLIFVMWLPFQKPAISILTVQILLRSLLSHSTSCIPIGKEWTRNNLNV